MAANYFYGLGRRKSATARVRLSSGKAGFTINDKEAENYFSASRYIINQLQKPFNVLELNPEKYGLSVRVKGGGHSSQVDAIILGLSKALVKMNKDFHGN